MNIFSNIYNRIASLFQKKEIVQPFILEDPTFRTGTKFYVTVSTEKQPEFKSTNMFIGFIEETFWVVNAPAISLHADDVALLANITAAQIEFTNGALADFSKLGNPFTDYQSAKLFKERVQSLKAETGLPVFSNVSIVDHSEEVPVSKLKTYA